MTMMQGDFQNKAQGRKNKGELLSENKAGQGGGREACGRGGTGTRRTGLRQLPSQTGCAERVKHRRAGDARQPWTSQRNFKGLDNICFSWLREPCSFRVSWEFLRWDLLMATEPTDGQEVRIQSALDSNMHHSQAMVKESPSLLSLQLVLSSLAAHSPAPANHLFLSEPLMLGSAVK